MKTHLKLTALLSAAVLLLCACSQQENRESSDTSTTSTTQTESGSGTSSTSSTTDSTSSSTISTSDEPDIDKLPRMDGSTSAIPLEIGLKSGLFGIPYEQAKELVSHTTTHDSFKRLISGEVDLILSVPISDEQQKLADDAGVKLFMEPAAREGFVFAVNANNPVDSLTQEQLRGIYSGEITNWSQVGGNDEEILPYQRNTDSGSQNYMTVFMGDTPLLEPKVDFIEGSMSGLMDAVAVYDNSAGAIGYSVYSYAAQMYANANKVKFIAVDGVAPSKATMADESYPLLSCTYLIYTDKSPESAKEFVAKAVSDEGQRYVLESGYLPVNGMEVPEKYLPYEAVGTGNPRPADFKPSDKYSYIGLNVRSDYYPDQNIIMDGKYFALDFLKNTELQDRINSDIRAAMDRLREYELPQREVEYRERNPQNSQTDGMFIYMVCRNGYLSIIVGYDNSRDTGLSGRLYYKVETLNYDLFSGKKLEHYSDLFYEGEDFLTDVNKQFALNSTAFEPEKKLDFYGILGEPKLFTIDGVILEPDNIYFTVAPMLQYDDSFNFHSRATEYRDMRSIVSESNIEEVEDLSCRNEWETAYVKEEADNYLRVVGSPFHTAEEVKARDELMYGLQKRAWEVIKKSDAEWFNFYNSRISIRAGEYDNFYCVGYFIEIIGEAPHIFFDKESLDVITMDMLLGEGWQQYLTDEYEKYKDLKFIPNDWYQGGLSGEDSDSTVIFGFAENSPAKVMFNVPTEIINKKYLQ